MFDEKKEDGVIVVVANVYHMDYDYAKYTEHLSLSQLANCDDFIVWYYSTDYMEYTRPFMSNFGTILKDYYNVCIRQEGSDVYSFYVNNKMVPNVPCPRKPYGKNPMTSIIEGGFSVNFKVNKRIRIKKEESQND